MGDPKVGSSIRRARLGRHVTLRDLARRIGVSPATVSAIENGHTALTLARLEQIAVALQVPLRSLIDRADPVDAPPVTPGPTDGADWRHFGPLTSDRVVAAAARAFVATGYHGTNMRAIATEAGISVAGVYHHHDSKQELLVRVFDATMSDLEWRLDRAVEGLVEPVDRLHALVEAVALHHARRRDVAFVGASEMRSLDPEAYAMIAARRTAVQQRIDDAVRAAAAPGALTELQVRNAGNAIATMCTSIGQWFHVDGDTSAEDLARDYARFAVRMTGRSSPG